MSEKRKRQVQYWEEDSEEEDYFGTRDDSIAEHHQDKTVDFDRIDDFFAERRQKSREKALQKEQEHEKEKEPAVRQILVQREKQFSEPVEKGLSRSRSRSITPRRDSRSRSRTRSVTPRRDSRSRSRSITPKQQDSRSRLRSTIPWPRPRLLSRTSFDTPRVRRSNNPSPSTKSLTPSDDLPECRSSPVDIDGTIGGMCKNVHNSLYHYVMSLRRDFLDENTNLKEEKAELVLRLKEAEDYCESREQRVAFLETQRDETERENNKDFEALENIKADLRKVEQRMAESEREAKDAVAIAKANVTVASEEMTEAVIKATRAKAECIATLGKAKRIAEQNKGLRELLGYHGISVPPELSESSDLML